MATALPYRITLRAPVAIRMDGNDPDGSSGVPFIPGSAIRGAIAAALLRKASSEVLADPAMDPQFREMILDGGVRFLHAYVFDKAARRTIPMPLSWYRLKSSTEQEEVTDFAFPQEQDAEDGGEQWVRASDGFCFLTCESGEEMRAKVVKPSLTRRLHMSVDRAAGRAKGDGHGTIYSYESLEAGTELAGAVIFEDDTKHLLPIVKEFLQSQSLSFGRALANGYGGRPQIAVDKEIPTMGWRHGQRVGTLVNSRMDREVLSVLLTSDYIGAQDVSPLEQFREELSKRINVKLAPPDTTKSFIQVRTVGGYNQTWHLPLPQRLAIRAGSVLSFTITVPLGDLVGRLEEIEASGLGVRTSEGFGQILFQVAGMTESVPTDNSNGRERKADENQYDDPPGIEDAVPWLTRRLVIDRLESLAVQRAVEISNRAHSAPKRSLLGRIRQIARNSTNLEELSTQLQSILPSSKPADKSADKPAARQLRRCYWSNQNLASWLDELVRDRDGSRIWAELDTDRHLKVIETLRVKEVLADTDVRHFALRVLIDSTMSQLARRSQIEEANKNATV